MKVDINGTMINYEILGQTGVPIVLIHGFGLDHSIWMEMAMKYLQNHRVIIPDVRGHGESGSSKGVYSMEELADDIYWLLEFFGIKKAVVCGHSMGGYISLAFAERYPDHLMGLGLITTHARSESEEKSAARHILAEEVENKGAIVLAETLAPLLSKDEEIIKLSYELIMKSSPNGIIGVAKGMALRPDRLRLLHKINLPALVVAGEADQIVPLEKAKEMVDALPQGELLMIAGAGHMPMLEASSELGNGLNRLINRIKR